MATEGLRGAWKRSAMLRANFLRSRYPAARRKPVVCHPWQTALVGMRRALFRTVQKRNGALHLWGAPLGMVSAIGIQGAKQKKGPVRALRS